MKVALIASDSIETIDIAPYLPPYTTVLMAHGSSGFDRCVEQYAWAERIAYMHFQPNYHNHDSCKNCKLEIAQQAEYVLIFWDGISQDEQAVVQMCKTKGYMHELVRI